MELIKAAAHYVLIPIDVWLIYKVITVKAEKK